MRKEILPELLRYYGLALEADLFYETLFAKLDFSENEVRVKSAAISRESFKIFQKLGLGYLKSKLLDINPVLDEVLDGAVLVHTLVG